MGKIIEVLNAFKNYDKKKVLEKVSFSIEEGQFVTLIGCNGAGKSTTLRILCGQENADSGSVRVFGQDPYSYFFKDRTDLFFIHENLEMEFPMNLLEMVKIYKGIFPKFKSSVFNQMLKDRKISVKKKFADLSRGQKMQFMLMLGLAANPRIMFLDEITAVIDIEGQRYFLDKLKAYVEMGGTVVISTNILSELNDYTDRLLLIQETKLMVDEKVSDLQKRFYMLKKTEEHPVFKHPKAARIRKDYDGKDLYLIPRDVIDEDTEVLKFRLEYPPKLEDILILHFQLKQEQAHDEMVA